jgi:hypothetical protein
VPGAGFQARQRSQIEKIRSGNEILRKIAKEKYGKIGQNELRKEVKM